MGSSTHSVSPYWCLGGLLKTSVGTSCGLHPLLIPAAPSWGQRHICPMYRVKRSHLPHVQDEKGSFAPCTG